jgi:adiponectin receptor
MLMLGFSAYYHNFGCQSESHQHSLRKLDFAGIGIGIWGGQTPPIYYWLMCQEQQVERMVFCGIVFVCCATSVYLTFTSDRTATDIYRTLSYMFAASSMLPGILYCVIYLDPKYAHETQVTGGIEVLSGLFYLTGAVFYMTRFPEKWWPGVFDYFGSSH